MHTVLFLASLLVVFMGSVLTLRLQHRFHAWSQRRLIQGVVLTMPLLNLGSGFCELHYVFGNPCFLTSPSWDVLLGGVLALGTAAMALGALSWGGLRLVLMLWVTARAGEPAHPALEDLITVCSERSGIHRPAVRLLVSDQPLACTAGWFQPLLLLSTWMVESLDRRELEAVITHELGHVARRDTLVLWLGRVLRDSFWYLPTSRKAYRMLEQDKEFACDDLTVGITRRPLALASALTKVWLQAVDGTSFLSFGNAQHLAGTHRQIHERIERLVATPKPSTMTTPDSGNASVLRLRTLGAVEMVILAFLFAVMACGPVLFLVQRL